MLGWNGPHGPCPRGYGREAKSSGRGGRRGSVRRGRPRPPPRGAMVTAASFGERRAGGGFARPLSLPRSPSTSAAAGVAGGFAPGVAGPSDASAPFSFVQGASQELRQRPRLRGGGRRARHAAVLRRGCEWRPECLRPRVPGFCGPGLPFTRG